MEYIGAAYLCYLCHVPFVKINNPTGNCYAIVMQAKRMHVFARNTMH
jgi:hypothetical protein